MRALITGCSGFIGQAMSNYLLSKQWEVFGLDQYETETQFPIYVGDIQDHSFLTKAIKSCRPDAIFHFAGIIKSENPTSFFEINTLGTLTLFEALITTEAKPSVLIASSSSVYGPGAGKRPISENFSLRPFTNYAASKIAQEYTAIRFFHSHKIPVFITRTFNLLGPGQSPQLACSSFARQIAIQENAAKPEPIKTGDINNHRDFLDIRDAINAYEKVILHGKAGAAYNVCSGQSMQLKECLDILLKMSRQPLNSQIEKNRKQKSDIPIQIGNNNFLRESLNWKPEIGIVDSLNDLLNFWRIKIMTENKDGKNVPVEQ